MSRLRLDLPFGLKASKIFQAHGIEIDAVMNHAQLVEALCQLK